MAIKAPSRQVVALIALVAVLGLVLGYQWWGATGTGGGQAVAVNPVASRQAAARDRAESVPALKLPSLKSAKAEPTDKGRNLFRELPKAPPPAPKVVAPPPPPPPDPNAPPPPPPPPPPITLKLVAIVRGNGKPVVALSDSRDVFYGREGDVIEGRYRIIRVNVESIDIAYVDGRGQRRLSLTGG